MSLDSKMAELAELEKNLEELSQRKAEISEELQKKKAEQANLEALVSKSGFDSPEALANALAEYFGVIGTKKTPGKKRGRKPGPKKGAKKAAAKKSGRKPGRPAGSTTVARKGSKKKRSRTKVTAALRDDIKREIASGVSKNKVAKQRGISYQVILKIDKGGYDKL